VYVAGMVVVISAMQDGATAALQKLSQLVGVSRRTIARWRKWWLSVFALRRCNVRGSFMGISGPPRRGHQDRDWALISRLSMWTVPVSSPVMRATLPMPRPLTEFVARTCDLLGLRPWPTEAPPDDARLGRYCKCPSRLILALMALRPAFTRWRIMLRSNSEKAPVTDAGEMPDAGEHRHGSHVRNAGRPRVHLATRPQRSLRLGAISHVIKRPIVGCSQITGLVASATSFGAAYLRRCAILAASVPPKSSANFVDTRHLQPVTWQRHADD
jgi:hypothetical protein